MILVFNNGPVMRTGVGASNNNPFFGKAATAAAETANEVLWAVYNN